MKLAIDIASRESSNPVQKVLELILPKFTDLIVTVTNPEEADVVIANEHSKLLGYLKQGKTVIQFLCGTEQPAAGLLTAPNFKDRFRIFAVIPGMKGGYPGFVEMLAYFQELAAKEKTDENPRS